MVDMDNVLAKHSEHTGVLEMRGLMNIRDKTELSEAYTPGVAGLSKLIESNPAEKAKYTLSGKLVAVISDGTAVLGLGNVGPGASLPIIEGKSLIYKEFAGVDAIPIAIDQVPTNELIRTIKNISTSFAGIHLEDIEAPRAFEVETQLKNALDIPVYHDDQEGTAIVVLAGLINAARVVGKSVKDLRVVLNGVGASGYATGKLLLAYGIEHITFVDLGGAVRTGVGNFNEYQLKLASGALQKPGKTLDDIITDQDVFIGLSDANVLNKEQVEMMADDAIIFALANPVPEILPEEAFAGGAAVVATGSSQWANQVNNVLAFPGLFQGLLQTDLKSVDDELQIAVADALAGMIKEPKADRIIPGVFDEGVVENVSAAVQAYARR